MPAPGTNGKMPHSKNTVAGARAFTAYQRESNAKGTLAASVALTQPAPSAMASRYTSHPTPPTAAQRI